ncbi:MAG: ATP-dependent protease ATPase subunit HslU [Alphaproteobacteria bacterium]|nr:ATP-dependent protease ATPase subunit HslU [Alphaproteobacteria bacterium]
MSVFSPREIVSELDRFIIGQTEAKKAVANALRNRWRRQQIPSPLRDEIMPKNILMVGPTGVGKTEISRRLAKLANAPFLKVEATKFTEVGYVGRDVEQIIRDLVEVSIHMLKEQSRKKVQARAQLLAEDRVLEVLVGQNANETTKESFRQKLRGGLLDEKEIEIELSDPQSGMPNFEIPGMPGGSVSMINLQDLFGKGFSKTKKRKIRIADAHDVLVSEEADKLLDVDQIQREALKKVEQEGIVFIDEIDKICARSERTTGGDVSREGVQRDLLPLIEGTTVTTKYGALKTDYILFIASGAFHLSKPSDLLPELQGRLPIRVMLGALDKEDLIKILRETEANLPTQYQALLETEGLRLEFSDDGIEAIADKAVELNASIENIGARRLHTILEHILSDTSFYAADKSGETITVDKQFVMGNLGDLDSKGDLTRFIL